MRQVGRCLASGVICSAALLTGLAFAASTKKTPEPNVTSVYPFSFNKGSRVEVEIRGSELAGATALTMEGVGIACRVLSGHTSGDAETIHVELQISPDAVLGWHEFRVVTPRGVTNSARAMVVSDPVLNHPDPSVPLRQFPVIVNSRILHAGENDTYAIDPSPGETLTMEAVSGNEGFDPTLTLFEESGSWFDPHRLNRVAFNDEPLSFPGISTDARVVWRFTRPGKYRIQVNPFDGKGSPDYVYQLRISRGVGPLPPLHPAQPLSGKVDWEERQFTRGITDDWLDKLAERGGSDEKQKRPELFHAALESAKDIPLVTLPAMVEGIIGKPGETHVIRLKVEKAEDLAIEVETPRATLPRFNPVVRLMQPDGHEMATDVYTKLNNNGLYMMKMIEPKTVLNLQAPGDYTMAIRDITTGCDGEDFRYRILVRRQIPHVGKIDVNLDHINLEAGVGKPVSVKIDREEGFAGYVTLAFSGLPAGVTALQAMEKPEDNPPLPNAGKAERYFAKNQTTSVILVAASDAPMTPIPVTARLELRVVDKGKVGPVIEVREVPVMVVERKAS